MRKLIGVAGRARSGKDTFVLGLIKLGYTRGAFADALKQVTALVANEPLHNFTTDELKEGYSEALGMTRRKALQNVGKGMRDILRDDIWIQRLLSTWAAAGEIPFAISDVRYPNEARLIRERGGIVVNIERPGVGGLSGEAALHESERPLPTELVDFTIVNDGTVEDLHRWAATIAQEAA